jgi:hypothetical protein
MKARLIAGPCFLLLNSGLHQAAAKLFFEGVILSEAKDLLFARAGSKADPSVARSRRNLRMTLRDIFSQSARAVPLLVYP